MQYIMKPAISVDAYEVAFFDTKKDAVNLTDLSTVQKLSAVLKEARAFMGQDSFLNPVRGKNANGNYYLTFMRWSFYGYSTSQDYRQLGTHYSNNNTSTTRNLTTWSSKKGTGDQVQDLYVVAGYNVIAPVPTRFSAGQSNAILHLPQYKLKNTTTFNQLLTNSYLSLQIIQPDNATNFSIQSYGYNGSGVMIPAGTVTDWLSPVSSNGFQTATQYINALSDSSFRGTSGFAYEGTPADGLVYMTDLAQSTVISSIAAETIDLDVGILWLDTSRMLKFVASDWSDVGSLVPGTRPKLSLSNTVRKQDL